MKKIAISSLLNNIASARVYILPYQQTNESLEVHTLGKNSYNLYETCLEIELIRHVAYNVYRVYFTSVPLLRMGCNVSDNQNGQHGAFRTEIYTRGLSSAELLLCLFIKI